MATMLLLAKCAWLARTMSVNFRLTCDMQA
jgi:hypothetical protein